MKKYITGIFAIVLAIGASAFSHVQSKPAFEQSFYWKAADGTKDGYKTITQEQMSRGCNGSTDVCAQGFNTSQYTGTPSYTLLKN